MTETTDNLQFSRILCTVDVLPLRVREGRLEIGFVRRDKAPFKGVLALPGGFIRDDEDSDTLAAAQRIAKQKAGVEVSHLEQLATYSGRERDPRQFSISVAYLAVFSQEQDIQSEELNWFELATAAKELKLAFDHQAICRDAQERLAGKAGYTTLCAQFAGSEFTLPGLQEIYEALTGQPVSKKTFRRRLDDLGWAEPIEGKMYQPQGRVSRPAQIYRLKKQ